MYPFLVLGLPETASDAQVEARYHQLVRQHPPDRDASAFATVRAAYDALRDPRSRAATRLFHIDRDPEALTQAREWLARLAPARLSTGELGRRLRAQRP